ncbi:MAG: adenylosuccinate lyase [FCB group bacterium]|nr:adenylosuccinate lyase [FCB group bacterium]
MSDFVDHRLLALTPLDGRYGSRLEKLADYFSELALIRARVRIEVEYLIALSQLDTLPNCPPLEEDAITKLRTWADAFSTEEGQNVKEWESKTNHDVKAVELVIAHQLTAWGLDVYRPWVHFALTSEDVNNLAYTLNWKNALKKIWLPELKSLERVLTSKAHDYGKIPLLSLTHGQPATPTTVGKELAVVVHRLRRQRATLTQHRFTGKFSGATGSWAAHQVAAPRVDWPRFSRDFLQRFDLDLNPLTTQVEPYDSLSESMHVLMRIHSILIDFSRDMWLYISRGIFAQKKAEEEVGSSTMPHKINPIAFENGEGNLGLSNALFGFLTNHLTTSRLQRDLSGSTMIRNLGTALGYSYVGVTSLTSGIDRVTVNENRCRKELNGHWEVLAEAVQTVLRKTGDADAYNRLKAFSRGEKLDREKYISFIKSLPLPESDRQVLYNLTPENYNGLAQKLVEEL